MEMTFIQKGSNNPNMNDSEHKDYEQADISSSYIEIPLLLQYQQSSSLKIEGGLLSAYLIDGYYKDSNGEMPIHTVNPFIKYDFGLLLGIDYTFSNKLSLNTRLSNSILPVGAEDYDYPNWWKWTNRKGKYNSVLSFALHYNF